MYDTPWQTQFCMKYAQTHATSVGHAQLTLGSLTSVDDARRWSYLSSLAHNSSWVDLFRSPFKRRNVAANVFMRKTAMLVTMGLHYIECDEAQRAQETYLILKMMKESDSQQIIGGMYHLAGIGTLDCVETVGQMLNSVISSQGKRLALLNLLYVLPLTQIEKVICLPCCRVLIPYAKKMKWKAIHEERYKWNGSWDIQDSVIYDMSDLLYQLSMGEWHRKQFPISGRRRK